MKIKIFGKLNSAKCETTKNKFDDFPEKWDCRDKVELVFFDMDTVEGMAEGAFNNVLNIPATIIEKGNRQIARWDGEVPRSEEFKTHFSDLN